MPPAQLPHRIVHDAQQPGSNAPVAAEGARAPPRGDECLLQHVVHVGVLHAECAGEAVHVVGVLEHERVEGRRVTHCRRGQPRRVSGHGASPSARGPSPNVRPARVRECQPDRWHVRAPPARQTPRAARATLGARTDPPAITVSAVPALRCQRCSAAEPSSAVGAPPAVSTAAHAVVAQARRARHRRPPPGRTRGETPPVHPPRRRRRARASPRRSRPPRSAHRTTTPAAPSARAVWMSRSITGSHSVSIRKPSPCGRIITCTGIRYRGAARLDQPGARRGAAVPRPAQLDAVRADALGVHRLRHAEHARFHEHARRVRSPARHSRHDGSRRRDARAEEHEEEHQHHRRHRRRHLPDLRPVVAGRPPGSPPRSAPPSTTR